MIEMGTMLSEILMERKFWDIEWLSNGPKEGEEVLLNETNVFAVVEKAIGLEIVIMHLLQTVADHPLDLDLHEEDTPDLPKDVIVLALLDALTDLDINLVHVPELLLDPQEDIQEMILVPHVLLLVHLANHAPPPIRQVQKQKTVHVQDHALL